MLVVLVTVAMMITMEEDEEGEGGILVGEKCLMNRL